MNMRREDIAFIRIIAMLMVIFTHCIDPYIFSDLKIWDFGVIQISQYKQIQMAMNAIDIPAFCFISGYLYEYIRKNLGKYNDTLQFLKSKAIRLISPYIFWYLFIYFSIPGRCTLSGIIYSTDHLWFLLMLMWCFIFAAISIRFWEKTSPIINILAYLVFSSVFLILSHFNLLTQIFCLDMFFLYFPVFFLGILFAQYQIVEFIKKALHPGLLIVGMVLIMIVLFLVTNENYFYSYTLSRYSGTMIAILGLCFLYCIKEKLQFINTRIAKSLDKNSMGIYLIHLIVIIHLLRYNEVVQFMNQHVVIAPILLFIFSLLISWGASAIIRKTPLSFIVS